MPTGHGSPPAASPAADAGRGRAPPVELDPVTRLAARRALLARLEAEVRGAGEGRVSLVLLDVDRLTRLNEVGGSLAGDRVLLALASQLRRACPEQGDTDLVGRYGPGTAALVLPSRGATEGLEVANQLRAGFEALQLGADLTGMGATLRAGVAELPGDARTPVELCQRAEEALEVARRLGGNRCAGARRRVLLAGGLDAFAEVRRGLGARAELSLVSEDGAPSLVEQLRACPPSLMVATLDRVRPELAALTQALAEPAAARTRLVLVADAPPDPGFVARAERVPGARLVMGKTRLAERLADAMAEALGLRVRRSPRRHSQVATRIELVERGHVVRGRLVDVSDTGARLVLAGPVRTGERIRLLPVHDEPVAVDATVTRSAPGTDEQVELGLRFDEPRPSGWLEPGPPPGPREMGAATAAAAPTDRPARTPVFSLENVGRRYGGVEAVAGVSLSLSPGERVALIGPSGAGKSTLLRLLNTSLLPTAGRLSVLGVDPTTASVRQLRQVRARIATVYQQLLLIPQATVLQNVVAGRLGKMSLWRAALALISAREAERVAAVLDRVGMASRIYDRVDVLSGGEQQRVAIARALYQDPEVLIADEPLASVDPARSAEIVDLLIDVSRDRTLLLSTHQLEPVLPHVDRVLAMRGGKLAFDKPRRAVGLDDLAGLYQSERATRAPGGRSSQPRPATAVVLVGASNTPGELILPTLVSAFVRECPGVRVQLSVKDSQKVTEDVLERRVELGFVGARVPHPELEFESFAEDEVVLVASPSFHGLPPEPLSAALAARLPRVEREEGSGTRAVAEDYFAAMGVPMDPGAVALEVDTLVALKAAVLSGVGVAFSSRLAVRKELEAGLLREVSVASVKIPRRVFVARRRREGLSPAAARFLDVAQRAWVAAAHRTGRT